MTDITDAGPRLRQMNDDLTAFDQMRAEIERLRLTDAEREAVEIAIGLDDSGPLAATLRGLLDRVGPVRTPARETVEE